MADTLVLVDIGNARIAGMDTDLQSVPPREGWYEWSLTAFYIAYIAFEWMSLLWKVIPAHIYVSLIVLSWGLTASLQAVAVNYPSLIALRVLLGIGEAAFTGIPFYLSFFFKRHELAFRTAIFVSGMSPGYPSWNGGFIHMRSNLPLWKLLLWQRLFASSLSWLIIKLGETGPIAPWRLLFLLEGFPSVFMAVFAWHVIPDSPQTARYLSPRERKVARLRLRNEKPSSRDGRRSSESTRLSKPPALDHRDVLSVFYDPVAWLTALMFFPLQYGLLILAVFLPTILTSMGHSALSAQALAAPPYLAAFLIVLASAHLLGQDAHPCASSSSRTRSHLRPDTASSRSRTRASCILTRAASCGTWQSIRQRWASST